MATKRTAKKQETTVIYIGPTVGAGALMRFSVFRAGEFPPHIEELRAKSESLRGLFVPLSELAEARKRVGNKGDILNTYILNLKNEL